MKRLLLVLIALLSLVTMQAQHHLFKNVGKAIYYKGEWGELNDYPGIVEISDESGKWPDGTYKIELHNSEHNRETFFYVTYAQKGRKEGTYEWNVILYSEDMRAVIEKEKVIVTLVTDKKLSSISVGMPASLFFLYKGAQKLDMVHYLLKN